MRTDPIAPTMRLAVLVAELADTCPADALEQAEYARFEVAHGCPDRCGHCPVAECWAAWAEMDRGDEVNVCAACLSPCAGMYCSSRCAAHDEAAFEEAAS